LSANASSWKPLLIGAGTLALLAAGAYYSFRLVGAPPEDVGALYSFKPGTAWIYEAVRGKSRAKAAMRVKGIEGGRVRFESNLESPAGDGQWKERHVQYVEDGYLMQSDVEDHQVKKPMRLYKLGSRKGHSWASRPENEPGEYRIHHLGLTTVDVPAGRFENVICLRLALKATVQDFYLKPGVGLIKHEQSSPGEPEFEKEFGIRWTMSLLEFRKAP